MNAGWLGDSRLRHALMVMLAVYLAGMVVVLTPIRKAIGDEAVPLAPLEGVVLDPDAPVSTAPSTPMELSSTQELRARNLLAANDPLKAALKGVPYTVTKSGIWTTSGEDGAPVRTLGAVFVVTPAQPIDLKGVKLPDTIYDQTEQHDPPYQEVTNTVSAQQVNELLVSVDLNTGRVVDISPGPDSLATTATPPPDFHADVPLVEHEH
jgi:hypothetical protein